MHLENVAFRTSDHPRKFKNAAILRCLKYVPIFTLCATILLFVWTVWLLSTVGQDSFIFIFLTAEVYINWIAILYMRGKYDVSNKAQSMNRHNVSVSRVWFCTKCKMDTFYECHHCPLCEVCVIQKDHHCFFLGTCITRQNMKHFIVFCVYAAMSCFYTGTCLINDVALSQITLYFLPVSIGYFISGNLAFTVLCQVFIIDVILSIGFLTVCFGCYQVLVVCFARLPYSSDAEQKNKPLTNLLCAFDGPRGLINFLFPISMSCKTGSLLQINKLV